MASPPRKTVFYGERSLAKQVLAWRKSLGLTQGELERRAGLAHNAISRIEQGDVSPKLETVEKLAEALSISVEQLQFRDPVTRAEEGHGGYSSGSFDERIANLSPEVQAKAKRLINDVLDLLGKE